MDGHPGGIRRSPARIFVFLARRSRWTVLTLATVLLVLIGCIDYVTSVEMGLGVFYWIPVTIVTWYQGARIGLAFATASVAIAIGTDIASGAAHSHPFYLFWDVGTQFLSLAIVVWLLTIVKQLQEETRKATQREIKLQSSRAAHRELSDISYIIGHNLYAPVRAVTGFSEVLLENLADRLDPESRTCLERLQRSGQTMARLIDALLELIQVSGGELKQDRVDLSAVAEEVVARLRQKAPGRDVNVIIEPGISVVGDGHLLELVLECLLDNAWKFTANQLTPVITFGHLNQGGHDVMFVRDNGTGFNMAFVKTLFQPFQTLHKPGEFEGIGIGLSVAKRLILRHGGSIWAEGVEHQGATFFFTLEEDAQAQPPHA